MNMQMENKRETRDSGLVPRLSGGRQDMGGSDLPQIVIGRPFSEPVINFVTSQKKHQIYEGHQHSQKSK
jgi:hypothetical protein